MTEVSLLNRKKGKSKKISSLIDSFEQSIQSFIKQGKI